LSSTHFLKYERKGSFQEACFRLGFPPDKADYKAHTFTGCACSGGRDQTWRLAMLADVRRANHGPPAARTPSKV
jgi:hypothetical protein